MILDFNVEVGLKLGMAVLGGLQLVSYDFNENKDLQTLVSPKLRIL
jgi:hypothetical protein